MIVQYEFNVVRSKLPGGQLWIYKGSVSKESLLYIFAGRFREYNWELVSKLMKEAAERKDSDWAGFDHKSLILKDYPPE